jgi:hypothetical protein
MRFSSSFSLLSLALALPSPQFAQRVDPRNTYERVLCVVPMTGAGTLADPRRLLFAPAKLPGPTNRAGILGFSFLPSDDGRLALVEFVARDRAALAHIVNDRRPDIKVFERGRHSLAEVEAEFKRLRKNFDFRHFGVRMP